MPSPKRSKKKKLDDKQKSLFSFVDAEKLEEDKMEKRDEKEELKKPIEKTKKKEIKAEPIKEISEDIKEEGINIPSRLFFKGNDKKFGLKKADVKLREVKRESFSSKYIRYLIQKEKIVKNLERGLLLDVDYDGGQNKAYCKFYDLDTDDIK
ncbi:MAG: hypothetical protein ACFFC1_19115, partial [Promethearchaeota archaeon]